MANAVSIVMYHYVRDLRASRYPGIKGLDADSFTAQLDFLESAASFVSCAQVGEALDGGRPLPENAVLLTFDDGYIDHYTTVFPLLKERGIPAFFSMPGKILDRGKVLDVNKIHFILAGTPLDTLLPLVYKKLDYYRGAEYAYPDNETLFASLGKAGRFDPPEVVFIKRLLQAELPERLRGRITDELFSQCVGVQEAAFAKELYMSMPQVKLMARMGMEWGVHGYDHYWMNRLTPAELARDIGRALDVFSGILDPDRWFCCYPYGSYSADVIEHIRGRGAAGGFGTVPGVADAGAGDRFALPRLDCNDFPPKSERYAEFR